MQKELFDISRYSKPTTKATSERSFQVERFVTRLNESRARKGYKPYTAAFVATRMSYIKTDELDFFYNKLSEAKNFSALWHYYCLPKKFSTGK
jgi:hypothetical protein